jgi:hypothetical protein
MVSEIDELRTSIRRVAQCTMDPAVLALIPAGDPNSSEPYDEYGWHKLCEVLCDWVEKNRSFEEAA